MGHERLPVTRNGVLLRKIFKRLTMRRINRILVSATLIASVAPVGNWVAAQDLVPVGDISGNSSVFVFRNSAKGSPQKFATKQRAGRSKDARIESAKKIN